MNPELKQNKQAEIDFFNQFGNNSQGYDAFSERGYQRLIREFVKEVPRDLDLRVADLGCGTGAFTKRLYDKGYSIVGVDISPLCIECARKEYPGIRFDVGDIENLKFPEQSFGAISLFGVLHHFPDRRLILSSCRRLLKKNGILYTFDPYMNNPFYWIYRNPKSPFYSRKGLTENEMMLTKKKVNSALDMVGFRNHKVYCISGVPLNTEFKKTIKMVNMFLPFYNLTDQFIDFFPFFRNLIGSSLISISYKD